MLLCGICLELAFTVAKFRAETHAALRKRLFEVNLLLKPMIKSVYRKCKTYQPLPGNHANAGPDREYKFLAAGKFRNIMSERNNSKKFSALSLPNFIAQCGNARLRAASARLSTGTVPPIIALGKPSFRSIAESLELLNRRHGKKFRAGPPNSGKE